MKKMPTNWYNCVGAPSQWNKEVKEIRDKERLRESTCKLLPIQEIE